MIEHKVSSVEIGECFYAWAQTILDENVSTTFFMNLEGKPFPLPWPQNFRRYQEMNYSGENSSGTLANINQQLQGQDVSFNLVIS